MISLTRRMMSLQRQLLLCRQPLSTFWVTRKEMDLLRDCYSIDYEFPKLLGFFLKVKDDQICDPVGIPHWDHLTY